MTAASWDEKGVRRRAKADWLRALERTSGIAPSSTRTLARVVNARAAEDPERPALIGEDESLTYRELSTLANRIARWALEQGFAPSDRVALVMRNAPSYAAIWIGLSQLGIVAALINTQLTGEGLAHCIAVAAPKCIIADTEGLAALATTPAAQAAVWAYGGDFERAPRLDRALADLPDGPLAAGAAAVTLAAPALLIYTSGTTGLPKAAHVSHYRVMMWSEWFAGLMDAKPEDRLYDCLPMYHSIGGVSAVGAMLAAGGSVIVRRAFSARRIWADLAQSRATILQYIGELCRYMLAAPQGEAPRHDLRLCCGNGLGGDIWEAFQHRFAIPRILEFYAATEGTFSLFNVEGKPGAIGRMPPFVAHRSAVSLVQYDPSTGAPLRGADQFCVRCASGEAGEAIGRIDPGENGLATRFEGYTSASESDRKVLRNVFERGDAWFRTGDLMRQDEQGYFYFVDRIGDTFRWKGENVSTTEVEAALRSVPGVVDACVYGVSIAGTDGRAGMAALVVAQCFDLPQFAKCVEADLPSYARPVYLRLCAAFDTTGTFRTKKADFARQGFDGAVVVDDLYVFSADARAYVRLNR